MRESGRADARSALSSIVDLEDLDGVRQAIRERAIDYPVVVDKDFEIWSASANRYWPALYLRKLFNSPKRTGALLHSR